MQFIKAEWKKYKKALVALLGAVLTGLNVLYGNDPRVQAAIAALTVLGVYQARNEA